MLTWVHMADSPVASSAPSSPAIAAAATSPSASMVSTRSAPRAASAGESATVAKSLSGSAFARVRFQARTSKPAAASLRAIGVSMVPVPSTATVASVAVTPEVLPRLEEAYAAACTSWTRPTGERRAGSCGRQET